MDNVLWSPVRSCSCAVSQLRALPWVDGNEEGGTLIQVADARPHKLRAVRSVFYVKESDAMPPYRQIHQASG